MTGIEATSNAVALFREPKVKNAHRTLTVIMLILSVFLLGIGFLCPAYQIAAMNEREPGYQTILSQLVAAVSGRGSFYYVALASIFIVLTCSAQTSFADFPRVCRLLAGDRFLPPAFARRGRRLVFSHGIVVLAILAGALLVIFRGITDALIPLFAVGALTAFLFSQAGMVVHWLRRRHDRSARTSLFYNALGAVTTSIALVIVVIAKFTEGAWMVVIVGPAAAIVLQRIRRHYEKIGREIDVPLALAKPPAQRPIAIVPIESWNRPAEKALRFSLLLSDTVIAVHVDIKQDGGARLKELWGDKVEQPARAANLSAPRLEILESPYRKVYEPIVDFVQKTSRQAPSRLVTVILPDLAEPRWYEALLHNVFGAALKTLLYLRAGEYVVVVYVPWYLRDV